MRHIIVFFLIFDSLGKKLHIFRHNPNKSDVENATILLLIASKCDYEGVQKYNIGKNFKNDLLFFPVNHFESYLSI